MIVLVSEGGDIGDSHWRKEPYLALLRALDTFVARLKNKVWPMRAFRSALPAPWLYGMFIISRFIYCYARPRLRIRAS
jgi:hypothetical protein